MIKRYTPHLKPSGYHPTSTTVGLFDTWLLNLHPDKCHILTIGKQQAQIERKYTLNENELVNILEEKNLV